MPGFTHRRRATLLALALSTVTFLVLAVSACTDAGRQGGPASASNPAAGGGGAAPGGASPPALAPGSASPGVGGASPVPGGGSFTVNMRNDLRFDPPALNVPRGATISWVNAGSAPHTVTMRTVPSGAESFDSGNLGAGQNFSRRMDVPGTYQYICRLHEGQGMVASVVVGQ